jgi:uncharacterized protein (DUF1015 family)
MATVLPFRGMRPLPALAANVAAPPYDVVSSDEARALAHGNSLSFLHISKPEIDCDPAVDVYSDAVYDTGRANMARFISDGIFSLDGSPCFYLYRQSLGEHSQTGVVGLVSIDEYENDVIRKHELTRPVKENDRTRHMQAVQAQTGPVFLTYRAQNALDDLMADCADGVPVNDFISYGVQHEFWVINDAVIGDRISSLFQHVPTLFVADGHHRSAAAMRYRALRRDANPQHTGKEAYNYFMAVLFPHDQLNILGYHRVIRDLGEYDATGFLAALEDNFTVKASAARLPDAPEQFSLYLAGQWYRLDFRQPSDAIADSVSRLDVSILQDSLLAPLLGITDQRTDDRVDFIGGARGLAALEKAVDNDGFAAAIACHPVAIEQLMTIAGEGKLMPPKSTWFEPKLKSGLVIHKLD